jgi:hypothetical protein
MPRTKVGRIRADYGKSITNIKDCVRDILNSIFSYDFVMEKIKLAPSIIEFSTEETNSTKRKIEIHKRLAKENQHLPVLVISEFRGTFWTGELGAGPTESYTDSLTGEKWLGYGTFCSDGVQTIDVFAEDPDTRDALGDALSAGFLLYLRDTYYSVFKTFDQGKYTVVFDSSLSRSPGADLERDNDPEIKITTESIEIKISMYDETVYARSVPENVYQDAEDLGLGGVLPVFDLDNAVQIYTNLGATLKVGTPFQIQVVGGSGVFQYQSSDSSVNVDAAGRILPVSTGTATIVIYDSWNRRAFSVPITVTL